jgi:LacI family transcriptional regulator
MPRASIKDVAKLAGVSIATVSHVINDTRFVREETQQKVLDAIDALNYHPNAVARGMVTKSTRKIGLVISDITNPFFTAVARGIEDEINRHRYNTIFCNTDENPERENDYLHLLTTQQIDGLIIAPTGIRSEPLIQMANSGIPVVLIDRKSPGLEAPLVDVQNEEGAYQATRYLIELGHQQIAFLRIFESISTQQDRLRGFKRAFYEANLPFNEDWIISVDPRFYGTSSGLPTALVRPVPKPKTVPIAYDVLQKLFASSDKPSAIFLANIHLTLGTLYVFKEYGLKCPEDISLVSFDDHDWAPIFSPPLTVVRQPTYQLGQTAAQMLMALLKGETVETPVTLLTELIIRESCQAPKGKGVS